MQKQRTKRGSPRIKGHKGGEQSPLYKTLLKEVSIYTDGSASHTSRWGGWAFIIVFPDGFEISKYGSENDTTNNAMELKAAVAGMRYFRSPRKVNLISDSAYLVNTLALKWWKDWEKRGFIGKNGHVTPNRDLWIDLIDLSRFHIVKPIKIKGHDGDYYNERCDKLAKRARKAAQLGVDPDVRQVNRVSKRPSRKFMLAQAKEKG